MVLVAIQKVRAAGIPTIDDISPGHREVSRELSAASVRGGLSVAVSPGGLDPYRGLGAWIDLYDYGTDHPIDAAAMAAELQRRGVRTVYLQTSRWSSPTHFDNPGGASAIIEQAHARGIRVVGWYLPGFADLDRDVAGSLAVSNFRTPAGHAFDGFAADIEDNRAVGGVLTAFNAGVAGYSAKLRAAAPPGAVLGAIVPDAKNNLRAPGLWAGFPWPEIARDFDVVMPMAYWSVTKPACRAGLDADAYMKQVVSLTQALMGTSKPMHPIGGIADCATGAEVEQYVNLGLQQGWLGGSLYDTLTTDGSPWRERMWEQLRRFDR
jgi:hypothetical protein